MPPTPSGKPNLRPTGGGPPTPPPNRKPPQSPKPEAPSWTRRAQQQQPHYEEVDLEPSPLGGDASPHQGASAGMQRQLADARAARDEAKNLLATAQRDLATKRCGGGGAAANAGAHAPAVLRWINSSARAERGTSTSTAGPTVRPPYAPVGRHLPPTAAAEVAGLEREKQQLKGLLVQIHGLAASASTEVV